jgi:hypothetical protein
MHAMKYLHQIKEQWDKNKCHTIRIIKTVLFTFKEYYYRHQMKNETECCQHVIEREREYKVIQNSVEKPERQGLLRKRFRK